jgi:tRNA-splicing ligase RtcB (3'-phosphate/5'-hydroxy nucleic acid ligase)
MAPRPPLVPDGPFRYRIPRHGAMRVDGVVYTTPEMLAALGPDDQALTQVANVACLPGIVGASLAMPDFHWGYGFPIGGVAAFDPDEGGVVSPGGVGYDINCGVRLLATDVPATDLRGGRRARLADALFAEIPAGVGSHRSVSLGRNELLEVLAGGAEWAVAHGLGTPADTEHIEEGGRLRWADPDAVPERALERGKAQLGSLGSGNHFCEVDVVDDVYDVSVADTFGLTKGALVVQVHTGSRGLGHQTCEEALPRMMTTAKRLGIELPDRQLCCAPSRSPEGQEYLGAMAAAANFAFANRQIITHGVRAAFARALHRDVNVTVVYDVCHNIAKLERHEVDGRSRELLVHRKGATRALPPGDERVPERYRAVGQPVLVPGDMGRASYVLVGTEAARATFCSACHGAGRLMSRKAATRAAAGRDIAAELEARGILVRAASHETVVEEMPEAYKDVTEVIDVVTGAGLATKVAKLVPLAVVKG